MVRTRSFPNFWQALLLIGFYWILMAAPVQFVEGLGIESHPYLAIATVLVGSPLLALAVLWVGYRITREPLSEVFPLGNVSPLSAIAAVASTAGVWILIDAGGGTGSMHAIDPGNGKWALLRFVIPVIYAPLSEELLHRGLILRGFLSRYGKHTAILLSASLFGLVHAENAFSALCFGMVVGYIYTETRSLLPCLLAHATSNAMFSVGPRVNLAFWGWLGVAQPFWVRGPWYPALGILLAASGIGVFVHANMIAIRTAAAHHGD
jgi:membrane protease YdiL (CAAX protease family)